jgi:hypothetical protein
MSERIMEPSDAGNARNRRLGFALAALAVAYVVAVIIFIIFE